MSRPLACKRSCFGKARKNAVRDIGRLFRKIEISRQPSLDKRNRRHKKLRPFETPATERLHDLVRVVLRPGINHQKLVRRTKHVRFT